MAKRRFRSRGKFTRIRRRRRGGYKRTKRFIKAVVKRMSESKYSLSGQVSQADNLAGGLIALNADIAQGTDRINRIGNKIQYRYFTHKGNISITKGAVDVNVLYLTVRVIIFQLRLPLVAKPAVGLNWDFLFEQPNFFSTIRNQNVRVLYDKFRKIYTPNPGSVNYLPNGWNWTVKRRINNQVAFMNALDARPKDPKDLYYLLYVSDYGTAQAFNMTVQHSTRITFIDV